MQKKIQMCDHCGNPATAGRAPHDPDKAQCIECAAVETVRIPATPERRAMAPESIRRGKAWPAAADLSPDGTLWLHQARALEILERGENVVVSTSTASGKSLPFQLWALHGMTSDPGFTGIIFYPTKALANDQARRWQQACRSIGADPGAVGEINGDVPTSERDGIMRRARLIVMTPDVCHAWMTDHASTEPVRTFLRGLGVVIIDEAHTYEFVFGSNSAYLFRRLAAAAVHAGNPKPPQLIAATATIEEPLKHLENLTGQPFTLVDESENGSPRHTRTIHHIPLPARGDRERALANLITSIIDNDPSSQVIAFEDSRQGIERTVQMVGRPESVMPYRSGYLADNRREIENALRDNAIRGVMSTSALELGIDMPDLTHGINLDLPPQKKNFHQRLGRVGRAGPGTVHHPRVPGALLGVRGVPGELLPGLGGALPALPGQRVHHLPAGGVPPAGSWRRPDSTASRPPHAAAGRKDSRRPSRTPTARPRPIWPTCSRGPAGRAPREPTGSGAWGKRTWS